MTGQGLRYYNNYYSRRNVENKPSITKGLEDNTIFTYDDGDEDDDLFIKPMRPIIQPGPWQNELNFFCSFKSWIGLLILIGTKSSQLFLWVFLPALAIVKKHPTTSLYNGVALMVFTAIGCLVAIIVCHCNYHSKTYRNLSFGVATFFNGLCFLGKKMIFVNNFCSLKFEHFGKVAKVLHFLI